MALCWTFYIAGYLTGAGVFVLLARQRGWTLPSILAVMAAALLGGLASAHLVQWIVSGSSGRTVLGALIGGFVAVWCVKRRLGITQSTGDMMAIAVTAGEAVGRWACFYGGCCYGRPTGVAWAVWQHDAFRHPTQIYLSAANLAILLILLVFARTRPPQNGVFYLQVTLYCAARFLIEFFRDSHEMALGLSLAQWVCLAGLVCFAYRLQRVCAGAQRSLREDGVPLYTSGSASARLPFA